MDAAEKGGGKATIKTIQGVPLTVESKDKKVLLTDAKGNTATVTIANVMRSNGIIHVVNGVLQP